MTKDSVVSSKKQYPYYVCLFGGSFFSLLNFLPMPYKRPVSRGTVASAGREITRSNHRPQTISQLKAKLFTLKTAFSDERIFASQASICTSAIVLF